MNDFRCVLCTHSLSVQDAVPAPDGFSWVHQKCADDSSPKAIEELFFSEDSDVPECTKCSSTSIELFKKVQAELRLADVDASYGTYHVESSEEDELRIPEGSHIPEEVFARCLACATTYLVPADDLCWH